MFAASDEMHQWIADAARHGSVWDVGLDTVGSGCGAGMVMGLRLFMQKFTHSTTNH